MESKCKEKYWHKYNHDDSSFGQSSPEKPNVGKPMQQMRVSLLLFSKKLMYKLQPTELKRNL